MSPRARIATALAGMAIVAGSLAALALGATKTVADKKGDCEPAKACRGKNAAADIRSATAKTGGGKIRFTITSYNQAMYKLGGGMHGVPAVQVFMKVGSKNFITGSQDGHHLQIVNLRNGKVTGGATLRVPSKTTEVITFSRKALGGAAKFRWQATDPTCESCGPAADLAPNKGFVTQHT